MNILYLLGALMLCITNVQNLDNITKKEEIVIEDTQENKEEEKYNNNATCKITPNLELIQEEVIDGIKYTYVFNAEKTNLMIDDVLKASKDNEKLWKNGNQNFEIKVELTDIMKESYFYPYIYDRIYRYVNMGYASKFYVCAMDYYINDEFCYTLYYIK